MTTLNPSGMSLGGQFHAEGMGDIADIRSLEGFFHKDGDRRTANTDRVAAPLEIHADHGGFLAR